MEAKHSGGLTTIPPDPLEYPKNRLSLELLARLLERKAFELAGPAARVRQHQVDGQVLQPDPLAIDESHRPLDDIL